MLRVIKVGGKLIENEATLSCLCNQLTDYHPECVLVHGGGSMAGQLSARLGMPTRMHEGRRITDRETLEVAVMVYAGLANKKVVAALQAREMNACGLSGCDMKVVRSHKRQVKEIDWGFVGDIEEVNTKALDFLLDKQIMPVLSPVTFDGRGQLLNTNADSVAGAVAMALGQTREVELIFCFDKPGVLLDVEDETSVIAELDEEKYRQYLQQGLIHAGMMPKLENAFQTIRGGVKAVRLTGLGNLSGGTLIK